MSETQYPSFVDAFLKGGQRGDQISQEGRKIVAAARALFLLATAALAMPMELVLRHRFGERYLTVLGFVFALAVSAIVPGFLLDLLAGDADEGAVALWQLTAFAFTTLVLALGITHLVQIYVRSHNGVRWHSRSDGLPLPIWRKMGLKEPVIRLYIEPAACLAIALLLLIPAFPVAIYIAVAGVCLWINETLRRRQQRAALLDMIDGQIEAEEQPAAMRGAPAVETKGFTVRGMQPRTAMEKRTLEEMISNLDSQSRELMATPAQQPAT